MMNRTIGLALVGLGLTSACQEAKTERPAPAAEPAQASAPSAPAPNVPASTPASAPAGAPAGDPISGTLSLSEGVAPTAIQSSDVLFIMARKQPPDGSRGALVAVERMTNLSAESFPISFELSSDDAMVKGSGGFSGPFLVYARLDKDGDPMSKSPDDLYATVEAPVDNGATGLKLALAPKSASSSQPAPKPPAAD